MDALATLVGCFTAITPLVVIGAVVATLDYRVSGTRGDEARERALAGLMLSIGWGLSLGTLIGIVHVGRFGWSGVPGWADLGLTLAPVVMGVLPSGLLLIVASGPSAGTPDQRPSWRDWVDAY